MLEKDSVRDAAREKRRRQTNKDENSRQIIKRLLAMPEYQSSGNVMWYVDVRDEVRTRHALPIALASDREIVVPYCDGDDLRLFRLHKIGDLLPGAFGILEPRQELRHDADRKVDPGELDFVVVPGVAFDRDGGRLGHGRGFYDRLLAQVDAETTLVGLAFECQIAAKVPISGHDVAMDWLVTQRRTLRCQNGLGVRAGGEGW